MLAGWLAAGLLVSGRAGVARGFCLTQSYSNGASGKSRCSVVTADAPAASYSFFRTIFRRYRYRVVLLSVTRFVARACHHSVYVRARAHPRKAYFRPVHSRVHESGVTVTHRRSTLSHEVYESSLRDTFFSFLPSFDVITVLSNDRFNQFQPFNYQLFFLECSFE